MKYQELRDALAVIDEHQAAGSPSVLLTIQSDDLRALLADADRADALEAARIAYASEFPAITAFDEAGQPDVDNIHANIRKLKAELKAKTEALEHLYNNAHRSGAYMGNALDAARAALSQGEQA